MAMSPSTLADEVRISARITSQNGTGALIGDSSSLFSDLNALLSESFSLQGKGRT